MKFRFCGDLDCPDWILAEINTLARLTSIKMKLLCQQVVKSLTGDQLDYEKIKKITSDSKFEMGEVKACIAAIAFILSSSARHGVDEETLSSELQQLGLPREHSTAICRVYRDNLSSITSRFRDDSLRLSRLEGVRWRVDVVCGSSFLKETDIKPRPEIHLSLDILDNIKKQKVNQRLMLSVEQLRMLISDLKMASSQMDSLK